MAVAAPTRGRGRPRTFDWEEARRLHSEADVTIAQLAERFGVSEKAIRYALDEDFRNRQKALARRWADSHRVPCLGGCGTLVWMHGGGRSGLCRQCHGALRTQSVREDALRCSNCREWKADETFPRKSSAITRRGRAAVCTPCDTIARQKRRERRKVPCAKCGSPRLAMEDSGAGRYNDTGLCVDCYHDARRRAAA